MSSQRGNVKRTRDQKYKNKFAFKNDLHDKTPLQQKLNTLHVSTVCQRCKDVIEWKIKYKKYKPLSQPKTCTRCQQRNVRKAYHVICRDCAAKDRVCAKCLKSADEVTIEAPESTPQEQQQLQVEMERLIKTFSERKRRAFLRYMNKGKKDVHEVEELEERQLDEDNKESMPKPLRQPHTRDELLEKIKQLKLKEKDDDDDEWDLDLSSGEESVFNDDELQEDDDGTESEDDTVPMQKSFPAKT